MGLDMYLTKKVYVGAEHEHNKVTGVINLKTNGVDIDVDFKKVTSIDERVGYWRKANQIHAFFVKQCQGGVDECQLTYVPHEKLEELRDLCLLAVKTKDADILAPASGFFFGGTEIDDYYWRELKETAKMLKNIDPNGEYYYQSSW